MFQHVMSKSNHPLQMYLMDLNYIPSKIMVLQLMRFVKEADHGVYNKPSLLNSEETKSSILFGHHWLLAGALQVE